MYKNKILNILMIRPMLSIRRQFLIFFVHIGEQKNGKTVDKGLKFKGKVSQIDFHNACYLKCSLPLQSKGIAINRVLDFFP